MKRGIILLLAVCATMAAAEEPQAPVAPPVATEVQPEAPADQPADQQSEALRLLEQSRERYRQLLEERRQGMWQQLPRMTVIPPNQPCYFIRMIRPVMPPDQQRSGLIPLQARVNAVQRGPDCSNGGQLAPLIPTDRPDDSATQSAPALTPVMAPAPAVPAAEDR